MIGCPGDIQREVQLAQDVITRWTSLHAEQNSTVLIPINWDTNSYPEHGGHPQKILNSQLANKSDMLVAVFGSRVGSPTDTSLSGTIEEIEEHIKSGKPVMLFFRKLNDLSKTSSSDLAQLESFKNSIQDKALYREYNTEADFEKVFADALELFLSDHWIGETPVISNSQKTIHFSNEEIEILNNWVNSTNPESYSVRYKGGAVFVFGDSHIEVTNGRELVKWKDFMNRLEQFGFTEHTRYTRTGESVYQLCTPAYEYIDSLDKQ